MTAIPVTTSKRDVEPGKSCRSHLRYQLLHGLHPVVRQTFGCVDLVQ